MIKLVIILNHFTIKSVESSDKSVDSTDEYVKSIINFWLGKVTKKVE